MRIEAIKTHKVDISDSLAAILDGYIKSVCDEDIIIITSKIISILQGRLVSKETIDKRLLVQQEADLILKTERNPYDLYLTIKGGVLIPSAGIDESNVDGYYGLSNALWAIRDTVGAISGFEKILKINPQYKGARHILG
ncbi:MAG: hypothetical protein EBY20_07345, partial [Alphaproteobacteria bacterium]|nr:hypothetical protein [Alphaproteobacteria bacterium]